MLKIDSIRRHWGAWHSNAIKFDFLLAAKPIRFHSLKQEDTGANNHDQ